MMKGGRCARSEVLPLLNCDVEREGKSAGHDRLSTSRHGEHNVNTAPVREIITFTRI